MERTKATGSGASHELMADNVWATSFPGTEIARRKAWGGRDDLRF
ncbi:hypothetical protein [Kocuria marina]|nr:hypothetical protein [Kocuria marina]